MENFPHFKPKTHRATMDRYLSIVEEHTTAATAAIDEVKLKQFLSQTKVLEYARITEQDYKDMSAVDRFALLQDYYSYMCKITGPGIHFFLSFLTLFLISNRINQASVIKLTKQSAGSTQNFSATLAAESKNGNVSGDVSEIAGEPVWKKFGFFEQLRTDYSLEKANFPENLHLYINQVYLTVQKLQKKAFMANISSWGRSRVCQSTF